MTKDQREEFIFQQGQNLGCVVAVLNNEKLTKDVRIALENLEESYKSTIRKVESNDEKRDKSSRSIKD